MDRVLKIGLMCLFLGAAACGDDSVPVADMGVADTTMADRGMADVGQPDQRPEEGCDEDGDGFDSALCEGGTDCDDTDPYRFPGNPERCDGVLPDGRAAAGHDEDCNPCTFAGGGLDGNHDGDLFINTTCANSWPSDDAPVGCDPNLTAIDETAMTVRGNDCDDGDVDVHPGQTEVCFDGIDNNCDGQIDIGLLYPDLDNDGRGDASVEAELTMCRPGMVFNNEDCDDVHPWTYLGAREICDGFDNDCSLPGDMAGGPEPEDLDGDGFISGTATCGARGEDGILGFWPALPRGDCDDTTAAVSPNTPEVCNNGIDDDCNGIEDDDTQVWYRDRDEDGYGDLSTPIDIIDCIDPRDPARPDVPLYVNNHGDCDDTSLLAARRYPGNAEICDRIDNNCSTPSSPEVPSEDIDQDGFAPVGAACIAAGGFPRTDCNDSDLSVYPGATELCDGVDSNCSTGGARAVDEDFDEDGYAPPDATCVAAGEVGATVGTFPRTDCDDREAAVHPGASELDAMGRSTCDGLDNDCDSSTIETTYLCSDREGYCGAGGVCGRGPAVEGVSVGGGFGSFFGCGLLRSGQVSCWGANSGGQLGDGTFDDNGSSPRVVDLPPAVSVSSGPGHSCAVLRDGRAACWGQNYQGELGDGTYGSRSEAVIVSGVSDVRAIEAGNVYTCLLRENGQVYCWGDNISGQLGNGTREPRLFPTRVAGIDAVEIAVGSDMTCALEATGEVYCWGASRGSYRPELVVGVSGVERLDVSSEYICALTRARTVLCWNAGMAPAAVPVLVNVVSVAAGRLHACAIRDGGTVWCWGDNSQQQLGDGSTVSRGTPALVPGLSGVLTIDASEDATCAHTEDGTVFCWGDGRSIYRVDALLGPVQIRTGFAQSLVRTAGGDVYSWGHNMYGSIGDGTMVTRSAPTHILNHSVDVATTGQHGCSADRNGDVLCWGSNTAGRLGDRTTIDRPTPVNVLGIEGAELVSGSCAILTGGQVSCWGGASPPRITALTNMTEIAAGGGLTLRMDGTVWTTQTDAPISGVTSVESLGDKRCFVRTDHTAGCLGGVGIDEVVGLSNVAAISDFCAVLTSGEVWCWGNNAFGQLGDGTTTDRPAPVQVLGLSGAIGISASDSGTSPHACALLADHSVYCWGHNEWGQLGNGSTLSSLVPVLIRDL